MLLVGGTCKIPAVREMMEARFGARCLSFDPLTAVAEGASILAADQLGLLGSEESGRRLELKDVASHGLGLSYEDPHTHQERYGLLIPPGAELPFRKLRSDLTLKSPTQQTLTITLYEGYATSDSLMTDARATRLREETIHDIPVSTTGARRSLSVLFVYDENAVMALEARIEGTDKILPLRYDARRSARDIDESAQRVRVLWSYTGQAEEEEETQGTGNREQGTGGAASSFIPHPSSLPAPPTPNTQHPTPELDARLESLSMRLKQLKLSDLIRSNPARRDTIKQLLALAETAKHSEEMKVKEDAIKEIEDRSRQWADTVPA